MQQGRRTPLRIAVTISTGDSGYRRRIVTSLELYPSTQPGKHCVQIKQLSSLRICCFVVRMGHAGFAGGQIRTGIGFHPSNSVFPCQLQFHQSCTCVHQSPGRWVTKLAVAIVTTDAMSWTELTPSQHQWRNPRFQASAEVKDTSSLFRDVTQSRLVVTYWRFGTSVSNCKSTLPNVTEGRISHDKNPLT